MYNIGSNQLTIVLCEQEESEDEEAVEEVKSEEKEPDLFDGGTMRPYQIDGFRWLVVMKNSIFGMFQSSNSVVNFRH